VQASATIKGRIRAQGSLAWRTADGVTSGIRDCQTTHSVTESEGQTKGAETEGGEETLGGSMLVLLPTHPFGVAGGAAPLQHDVRRLDDVLEPHATLGSAMRTLRGDTKDDGGFLHAALAKQRGLMKLLGQTRMVGQVQEVSCGSASLVQTSETINRRSTVVCERHNYPVYLGHYRLNPSLVPRKGRAYTPHVSLS
jgi:hypothetical protein